MSLKKQLEKDMKAFFNVDEFAETHVINSKTVACVLMRADKDPDVNSQSKQGLITSYASLMINASDASDVVPNAYLEIDAELYTVVETTDVEGMIYIDLSKPIGKFNKLITVQEFTTEKVNGFKKEVWTNIYECMAYIRHMGSKEMVDLGTILTKDTLLIKMHYTDHITTKMRVLYKDKVYNIKSIDNLEEKDIFLDLICESGE